MNYRNISMLNWNWTRIVAQAVIVVISASHFTGPLIMAAVGDESGEAGPDSVGVYRTTPQGELKYHLFRPEKSVNSQGSPAILFFFGGGWVGGTPGQFFPQAEHFSSLGMVAICLEYRVQSRHNTTPFESVSDGLHALAYFQQRATEYGIDPDRIVVSGGSAGGHVAACTAMVADSGLGEGLLPMPAALLLFNPVIDTSADGYGMKKIGERWRELSPVHIVHKDVPPVLIIHGTQDTTVPFTNAIAFRNRLRELGGPCTVAAYPGQKHGFFNHGRPSYESTIEESTHFLRSLKLLPE